MMRLDINNIILSKKAFLIINLIKKKFFILKNILFLHASKLTFSSL